MASGFVWEFGIGNFFHQENFEETERDDNPIERGQDYMESPAKHPRKTRVVFRECAKMCVAGRYHDGRSSPSYWPILGTSAERSPSNDRVVRSIWRHDLVLWEQLIINHSLDIP